MGTEDDVPETQDQAPEQTDTPEPAATPEPQEFHHRRAPKYRAFVTSGLILGLVAGLVVASFGTLPADYSAQTVGGYFAAVFGLVGALLGGAAAIAVERRKR